jgi:RNA polymerase sigma-70 factor (ECF subfamily)
MNRFKSKSDAKLVVLALKKQDAFEELVSRYEKRLFRYIRRFAGLSDQCAEDILQEVFIKIYRNLNNFDPDLKFSSWAYRITHNETINHIRKNKHNHTIALETDDEDAANLIDFLSSEDDIPKEISKKELQKEVREILDRLSPDYKDVLILRFLEDLEYSEISDILKKPMGTVATLINRAKAQFKTLALKNHEQTQ